MSVKKTKRKKDYTSMKSVGVKSVDETFKVNQVERIMFQNWFPFSNFCNQMLWNLSTMLITTKHRPSLNFGGITSPLLKLCPFNKLKKCWIFRFCSLTWVCLNQMFIDPWQKQSLYQGKEFLKLNFTYYNLVYYMRELKLISQQNMKVNEINQDLSTMNIICR